jgi:hypothetical protein
MFIPSMFIPIFIFVALVELVDFVGDVVVVDVV